MSDNAANETDIYTLTLPDGLIIKYLKDGWRKCGSKHPNIMDDFLFVMYPEVESRIRYLANIKPRDIMIDVGACLGSWTIHAALMGAHVHAFEMGESQLKALNYNIRLNNVQDKVTIHDVALQANDTPEMLFDGVMMMRSKAMMEAYIEKNPVTPPPDAMINVEIMKSIKSTTLDTWMKTQDIEHIELVKMDVEGMEYEVLRGACNTLREFKPNCVIEIHEQEIPRYDVENFMKDLGYKQKRVPGLNDYFYI